MRIYRFTKNKSLRNILLVVIIAALAGCGGVKKPLVLFDDSYSIMPATIAVIAGSNTPVDIAMADALTREFETRTTFNVLPQKQIQEKIGRYPSVIERQEPENRKKAIWLSPKGETQLGEIQKKLKVNYLFVIWHTDLSKKIRVVNAGGGGSMSYNMTIIGNMVEYPTQKIVAFTNMEQDETPGYLNFWKPGNFFVEMMINDTAEKITDKIVALTSLNPTLKNK